MGDRSLELDESNMHAKRLRHGWIPHAHGLRAATVRNLDGIARRGRKRNEHSSHSWVRFLVQSTRFDKRRLSDFGEHVRRTLGSASLTQFGHQARLVGASTLELPHIFAAGATFSLC